MTQVDLPPEIANFYSQIQAHKQRTGEGQIQKSSNLDQELTDLYEYLLKPGSPYTTEIWVRNTKNIWEISRKPKEDFTCYYATWKYPTYGLWKQLGINRQNPYEQEKKIWKIILIDTNLVDISYEEEYISQDSHDKILAFTPALIPEILARLFISTTVMTSKETNRIEIECMSIWKSRSTPVANPHPILYEIINAMNLHEKFGIKTWDNLSDMHIRVYSIMRKVLECYSNAMTINEAESTLKDRAMQQAGLFRPRIS